MLLSYHVCFMKTNSKTAEGLGAENKTVAGSCRFILHPASSRRIRENWKMQRKTPLASTHKSRARGVYTQPRAKSLMGQGFSMHEKTLTLVSRLAFHFGGELGIRTLGGFTHTAFRVLSVEHHFEENKGRTEKLREDKNTNNSSNFRLFSVKNRGVSRVRMNHANLLKNGHFGEI